MMKGFVQTNGKYYDLDTGDELELKTYDHPTYGEIQYVEAEIVVDCDTCEGTGESGGTCPDCSGAGTITESEIPITVENPPDEALAKLPNGWKGGA